MIYSFKRLSEDGVLFPALVSIGSFAGTEVGSASQLAGGVLGVSRTLLFLVYSQACGSVYFSPPKKVCPPVERSLIAGHLAAITRSPL